MDIVKSLDSFEQIKFENTFVIAYFSGPDCSVCHALKPKIEELGSRLSSEVVITEIPVEDLPDLAAKYSVFTVPVILFFVEGREYIRLARYIDTSILYQKVEKIIGLYND